MDGLEEVVTAIFSFLLGYVTKLIRKSGKKKV